jgi:hypothetical protein
MSLRRRLHIDGTIKNVVFPASGQLHQAVAGKGLARVLQQNLEQGELTRREQGLLAVADQDAINARQFVETDVFVVSDRCARWCLGLTA